MSTLKFGRFKGTEFSSTPKWYQEWLSGQSWFKVPTEQPLHKQLQGWDGYSNKGQAIYDNIFSQEQARENALDAEEYLPGGKYYGI